MIRSLSWPNRQIGGSGRTSAGILARVGGDDHNMDVSRIEHWEVCDEIRPSLCCLWSTISGTERSPSYSTDILSRNRDEVGGRRAP